MATKKQLVEHIKNQQALLKQQHDQIAILNELNDGLSKQLKTYTDLNNQIQGSIRWVGDILSAFQPKPEQKQLENP
jgi:hypothetical protein